VLDYDLEVLALEWVAGEVECLYEVALDSVLDESFFFRDVDDIFGWGAV